MGQCQVERVQPEPEEVPSRAKARTFPVLAAKVGDYRGGQCAFFMEKVGQVPSLDAHPMCSGVSRHPSVAVWAEAAGRPLGEVAEWPSKSCLRPSWFSARSLGFELNAETSSAVLRVEIRDAGTTLAWLSLPLKGLALHERLEMTLETELPGLAPSLSFQLLDCDVVLRPRTVYLVRHGESQWNKAQGKMDIHGMVRTTDHSLSAKGKEQAEHLARMLRSESGNGMSRAAGMLQPGLVMSSPLGRALQTAVIAYSAVEGLSEIVLAPNAKEKQNLGGLDTHCTKVGQEILQGCLEELQSLYSGGKEKGITSTFQELHFDLQEVEDKWWPPGQSESTKQLQVRLEEFMYQLIFAPQASIVVFGHSLFFQQLMKRYLAESYRRSNDLGQRLGTAKLPNCGVVRLELEPVRMLEAPFVKAELVLGTELRGEGACMACCAAETDTANELRPDDIVSLPVESSIANVSPTAEPLRHAGDQAEPTGQPLGQPLEPTEPAKEVKVEPKAEPEKKPKQVKQVKKCCPL